MFYAIFFLFIFLIKRLNPLKKFMLIFKNENMINNHNIKKNMKKEETKAIPPKKNNNVMFSNLDDDKDKSNKNKIIKFKKENKNSNIFSNNVLNIDNSSSRKGIISENDYNIKYILNKGLKNNNLSKTINIQTPMLNINNFFRVNNFNQNNKIKKTNQKKIKK